MTTFNKKQLLISTAFISAAMVSSPAYAVCTPNVGTSGNDTITCTENDNTVNANDGDDIVNVEAGATVTGTIFLDSGNSESGNDTLNVLSDGQIGSVQGQNGNDTINILGGSRVSNNVDGGNGSDTIIVTGSFIGRTNDFFNGGSINAGSNSDEATDIDTVLVTNSSVDGSVQTGAGNDIVRITAGSLLRDNIDTNDGADEVTVTNSFIGRDPQTNNDSGGNITTGTNTADDGADIVTIMGSTVDGSVRTGGAGDTIIITSSMIDSDVQSGTNSVNDGDDTITITGSTVGQDIESGGGADLITVTNTMIDRSVSTGSISNFDGDDVLVLTNSPVGQSIQTGSGGDTVTIMGGSVETFILLGTEVQTDGNDSLTITNSDVGTNIRTGAGDDTVTLTNTPVGTNIDTGNGADVISVTGGMIGSFIDAGDINQNDGADMITLTNTIVDGFVDSGAAGDTITIDNTTVMGQVTSGTTSSLDGDDTVNIVNGSTTEDVLTGDGNDTLTITGSTVGDMALGSRGVDLGDGDDVINLAGTVNGFVDLGRGNDAITLGSGTVINTTNQFTVQGDAGEDVITIDGGTYTGISAGNDNDTVTLNGGTISQIIAGSGDDTINLFGGTITDADGLRAGSGDDTLLVDNAESATALNLTAITRFDGDGGTDTATFRNVTSGIQIADNVSFTQWDDITFVGSTVNLDNSTFINTVNLTSGSTLNQVDGNLNLGGGTVLSVDGSSRVNLQDGVTDDSIQAVFNPAAGSVLAVDVDVSQRGFVAGDSDFVIGTGHTPTAGATVDVNVIGEADLSGSRRIVDGNATFVSDPGVGAQVNASTTYSLVNDPSSGARRFWLQDDGDGGVFLVWTTPVSPLTTAAALGGAASGAAIGQDGRIDLSDPNLVVDPDAAGAGLSAVAAGQTAGFIADNINAASGLGLSGGVNGKGGNSANNFACSASGNGVNVWGSVGGESGEYGQNDIDTGRAVIGAEKDISSALKSECGRFKVGTFFYTAHSEIDQPLLGSDNEANSYGAGLYLKGATASNFYGSVMGYYGQTDYNGVNAVLESRFNYDSDDWGARLDVGKVIPISKAGMSADIRAYVGISNANADSFIDTVDFETTSIDDENISYGASVGLNKALENNQLIYGRAGVDFSDIQSDLVAFDIPVSSAPSYTLGRAELGYENSTANGRGTLRLGVNGRLGSEVEAYGASLTGIVRF